MREVLDPFDALGGKMLYATSYLITAFQPVSDTDSINLCAFIIISSLVVLVIMQTIFLGREFYDYSDRGGIGAFVEMLWFWALKGKARKYGALLSVAVYSFVIGMTSALGFGTIDVPSVNAFVNLVSAWVFTGLFVVAFMSIRKQIFLKYEPVREVERLDR